MTESYNEILHSNGNEQINVTHNGRERERNLKKNK